MGATSVLVHGADSMRYIDLQNLPNICEKGAEKGRGSVVSFDRWSSCSENELHLREMLEVIEWEAIS